MRDSSRGGLNGTGSSRQLVRILLHVLYAVFVLALALAVYVFFMRTSGIGNNGKASFAKVLTGTAFRPYVYRQLLPLAANVLAPAVDGMSALQLGRQAEAVLGNRFFRARLDGRQYPRQVILIMVMMYLSLVGFAATMWFLVRDLEYSRGIGYLAPPLALLTTTINFGFGYMYDFTVLFLFTLGLWLLHRRNWAAYLLVFALGTLNKETMVFLVLVFVAYYWSRLPRRAFLAIGGSQLAIFALIQGALRYRFRNNPGGAVEWHLPEQIPAYQLIVADSPWLLVLWIGCLALLWALVLRGWKRKPAYMRYALSPLPILVVFWFLWGYPLEIRALIEMLPVVVILLLPPPSTGILANEVRQDSHRRERQDKR